MVITERQGQTRKGIKMKIYTKSGDKGTTSLFDNTRVAKDSLRVESYGTIDELNSSLGFAKNFVEEEEVYNIIRSVQRKLFNLAGELACLLYTSPSPRD